MYKLAGVYQKLEKVVVRRIVVILFLVYLQPCISLKMFFFQRKYLDKTIRLNVINHFFS